MGIITRGEINNKANMQPIQFSGARWGNITPTDIDAFMDFKGKASVFVELKHKNAKLPFGQELALQRLCDDAHISGKKSVVFVASWEVLNQNGNIGFMDSIVTRIYMTKTKWVAMSDRVKLGQYIDRFLIYSGLIKENETASGLHSQGSGTISCSVSEVS